MKHIAMVAYVFPPLNFSGSERPFQFAKHLPKNGYLPQIISQDNYINYHVVANDFDKLKQLHPDINIYRPKTIQSKIESIRLVKFLDKKLKQFTGKVNIMSRILYIPFQFTIAPFEWELRGVIKIIKLRYTKNISLIWATGPAWLDLTVGYWASKITGLPYVMDLRDPMTYGLLWQPKDDKEAKKLLKRELKYLKKASNVIFTSPLTEKAYLKRYPEVLKNKTCTITNGFEETEIEKKEIQKQNNKFIISYIGRLTKDIRDPDFFLKGFKIACQNQSFASQTELQMIGYLDDFKETLNDFNTRDNIKLTGVVNRTKSLELMQEADALLIIQSISGEGSDVISGKLFEYINTQKFVIAVVDDYGGDSWLIKKTNCGVVTGLEDENKVAKALLEGFKKWQHGSLNNKSDVNYSNFQRNHLTYKLSIEFNDILSYKH